MSEIQQERRQQTKERLRTAYGIRENSNPMLSLPLDLYRYENVLIFLKLIIFHCFASLLFFSRSAPIECLHTILLGPYKYLLKKLFPYYHISKKKN